jgi:hypothetical protein
MRFLGHGVFFRERFGRRQSRGDRQIFSQHRDAVKVKNASIPRGSARRHQVHDGAAKL